MPRATRWFGMTSAWLLGAGVILVGQAAVLRSLSVREVQVQVPNLNQFPRQFGSWQVANEQTLEPSVLDFLQPDGYILRDYTDASRGTSMNLFVAFFKSLQNTVGPHSPHDCLPGSGWLIDTSSTPTFSAPGWKGDVQVNQYTMEKGGERILVVYWYQNDRHVWAQEFWAKVTLLPDLIRYRRSDVSLVRLITPMRRDAVEQAVSATREFTNLAFPDLVRTFRETN